MRQGLGSPENDRGWKQDGQRNFFNRHADSFDIYLLMEVNARSAEAASEYSAWREGAIPRFQHVLEMTVTLCL